jgi:hypothetical protein
MTQRDGELRDRGSSFSLRERNLSPTSPASLHRSAEVRNGLGGPNVDGRTSAYLGMILARFELDGAEQSGSLLRRDHTIAAMGTRTGSTLPIGSSAPKTSSRICISA